MNTVWVTFVLGTMKQNAIISKYGLLTQIVVTPFLAPQKGMDNDNCQSKATFSSV